MPVLTRGAKARLDAASQCTTPTGATTEASTISERTLGLREGVHKRAEEVWTARSGRDAYTRRDRSEVIVATPQVDHVLEVQLVEHALVHAMREAGVGGGSISMAAVQSAETLRATFNNVSNLNVTTARINQAKRGPFTAAMNRLRASETHGSSLRTIPLEQLARQGKAKFLVDDGTWAHIECEVVVSYEACQVLIEEASEGGLRPARELSTASVEELGATLSRLGIL